MKKLISLFLALAMLCSISACSANSGKSEEPSTTTQPEVSATVTVDTVDYVSKPSLPNLIGYTPKSINTWTVDVVTNYIPFTPDGYKGITADFVRDYTGNDGIETKKTYHVAFFPDTDDYKAYDYDSAFFAQAQVNGEMKNGVFIMNTENLFFLESEDLDGNTERYYLDINLPDSIWYAYVLDTTSDKALIAAGSYLFTYTFGSKKCELITKDAFDYNYVGEGTDGLLFFTDWEHNEHVCHWLKTANSTGTGKTVLNYANQDFSLVVDEAFTHDFEVMQKAMRDGIADEGTFEHLYSIYSFGNIYDNSGYYLSNIHLPKPYTYNSNVISTDSLGCWLTQDNKVTFLRYGEVVKSYDLGAGLWNIITTDINYNDDSNNGKWIGYDLDTNHDNVLTAKELSDGILSVQLLLYNAKDKCVYLFDSKGNKLEKLASDVVDYCEAYGELYWMNSKFEAYELTWKITAVSVLIDKDVVGISKHTDERAGFVVKPDDPRCNAVSDGFSLCTLYGREWLNQEQTSGAWALEHDWGEWKN